MHHVTHEPKNLARHHPFDSQLQRAGAYPIKETQYKILLYSSIHWILTNSTLEIANFSFSDWSMQA